MPHRAVDSHHSHVGCEIGATRVRLAQVGGAHPEDLVIAEGQVHCPQGSESREIETWMGSVAATAARLHSEKGFPGRQIVVSAPSTLVSFRRMQLPPMPDEEMPKALSWQLARELGLQQADICCDYYETGDCSGPARQRREIVAVSAAAGPLRHLQSCLSAGGLDLIAIDTTVGALARCLCSGDGGVEPEQPVLIVTLGLTATWIVVAKGGAPLFVHSFGRGRQADDTQRNDPDSVMRFVSEVTREIGICLHFLEERSDPRDLPGRACVVGAGKIEAALEDALSANLPMAIAGADELLVPELRTAIQQLPVSCRLDDWLVPIGLSVYSKARENVGSRA